MELSVKAGKIRKKWGIIYRSPSSGQNRFKATMFLDEWSVDDLVVAYYSGVTFLVDIHAPLQKKTITLMPNAP